MEDDEGLPISSDAKSLRLMDDAVETPSRGVFLRISARESAKDSMEICKGVSEKLLEFIGGDRSSMGVLELTHSPPCWAGRWRTGWEELGRP